MASTTLTTALILMLGQPGGTSKPVSFQYTIAPAATTFPCLRRGHVTMRSSCRTGYRGPCCGQKRAREREREREREQKLIAIAYEAVVTVRTVTVLKRFMKEWDQPPTPPAAPSLIYDDETMRESRNRLAKRYKLA